MATQRGGAATLCMWAAPFLVTLALAIFIYSSSAASVFSHPLSKRSFFDINCRGVYDKSIYARLDRVCQDCYNLYREPELHTLCRYGLAILRRIVGRH